MIDWTATREVTVVPRKRYTPEEILQHLRTIELETWYNNPRLVREARPQERMRLDCECGGMGVVEEDSGPSPTPLPDHCLRGRSQEGGVAQAGRC